MGYWLEALGRLPSNFTSTDMKGQVVHLSFGFSTAVFNHMVVYSTEAQCEVPVGEGSFYHT